jgi:hypothetical protein
VRPEAHGGNRKGKRRERIGPADQESQEGDGGRKVQGHCDHEKESGHEVYPLNFSGQLARIRA